MKKTVSFCLLAILLAAMLLVSCSPSEEALPGRWETQIEDENLGNIRLIYHFTPEGEIYLEQSREDTVPFSIPFGTYEIRDGKLSIVSDGKTSLFTFSVSDTSLTLQKEGEKDLVFTRV